MKIILPIILSLFLLGCASVEKPVVIKDEVVHLSPEVFEPCAFLEENIMIETFEDVIAAYGDLSTKYSICANKHLINITLLEKFSNK